MLAFILRRLVGMIPTLFLVSILTFLIIELPPGDFMSSLAANVGTSGSSMDEATVQNLRHQYGLDRPLYERYLASTVALLTLAALFALAVGYLSSGLIFILPAVWGMFIGNNSHMAVQTKLRR